MTKIHRAARAEQSLRLSHLRVIIMRDYLNGFLAYIRKTHSFAEPHTHSCETPQRARQRGQQCRDTQAGLLKGSELILAAKAPRVLEYSWPHGDEEKISVKEKTNPDPAARRHAGQMSPSPTHTHTHTYFTATHWWDTHSSALSHDSCRNSLPTSSERWHWE